MGVSCPNEVTRFTNRKQVSFPVRLYTKKVSFFWKQAVYRRLAAWNVRFGVRFTPVFREWCALLHFIMDCGWVWWSPFNLNHGMMESHKLWFPRCSNFSVVMKRCIWILMSFWKHKEWHAWCFIELRIIRHIPSGSFMRTSASSSTGLSFPIRFSSTTKQSCIYTSHPERPKGAQEGLFTLFL